jgi:hypothetical protein
MAMAMTSAPASAESAKTVAWTPAQVFPTAVRFLRIDEGLAVVEKDPDAGYILFDLTEENHTFRGALEFVAVDDHGQDSVRLVLRIQDRPEYMEVAMLERLEHKLRRELGSPKPVPRPAPKPAPPADPPADAPAK